MQSGSSGKLESQSRRLGGLLTQPPAKFAMLNTAIVERRQWVPFLILAIVTAGGMGLVMGQSNYDWQGLVIVATAIGILGVFMIPRLALLEPGDFLLKVLICGLVLKMGAAMVRLWVAFGLYEGVADASAYHGWGIAISQHIWRLEFDQVIPLVQPGTSFINFFTGLTYSLIGPTLYGGYLIYALLAFLGSYCFYAAFGVAFPQGNKRLYAVLVFLFPSILYWSNGIGKDALIFLCIGLATLGGAQLCRDRLRGLAPLVLGLLGVLLVRPHIAAILVVALALAMVFRGAGQKHIRPATFIAGLFAIGGLMWFLLPRAMVFLGVKELSAEDVSSFFQLQQTLTATGGATFQGLDITRPVTFLTATTAVIFRPFPWEAHNLQALIQSLEGILVIGLILWRLKGFGRAVVSSISDSYLRYILIYCMAFIVTFSVIGNFAILARERTMLLPLFFVLLAYDGDIKPRGAITS